VTHSAAGGAPGTDVRRRVLRLLAGRAPIGDLLLVAVPESLKGPPAAAVGRGDHEKESQTGLIT
jgi:hypothetical protein